MLRGCKGAQRLPTGRPLLAELIDRYRQSGRFTDPLIFGPAPVYRGLIDGELVPVEGNLAATLAAVREVVRQRFPPSAAVALSTCDILPTADEVRQLLETGYDPHAACCFWGQLVEAQPDELGASRWKPAYRMLSDDDRRPLNLYPGHLIIARPEALRIRLTNHILHLAYRYRNRDLRWRHVQILARGLGRLLWEDFRQLCLGKLPVLTISIPLHGLRGYHRLRRGVLTPHDFEHGVAKTLLHRRYQAAAGGRPVVFAITRLLSFAKDIDTVAELAEHGARMICPSVS